MDSISNGKHRHSVNGPAVWKLENFKTWVLSTEIGMIFSKLYTFCISSLICYIFHLMSFLLQRHDILALHTPSSQINVTQLCKLTLAELHSFIIFFFPKLLQVLVLTSFSTFLLHYIVRTDAL